jgi:hypothetical protein
LGTVSPLNSDQMVKRGRSAAPLFVAAGVLPALVLAKPAAAKVFDGRRAAITTGTLSPSEMGNPHPAREQLCICG